ncbi:uncharacterized protein [Haliotis cracherodii]|uniref:uncharacterized protein n=1 Tax=Haliotis cracherodii TaxID=6455 RepID=UPI0039EAEEC6
MNQWVSDLASRGKRALMEIFRNLRKIGFVDTSVFFKIFDTQIQPILLYGAEIWGVDRFEQIEQVHMMACKKFLNVGLQTPNAIVYGECGRYPLHVNAMCRSVKYWLKLIEIDEERIPRKSYNMLVYNVKCGRHNYASSIRSILFSHGFGVVWLRQAVGDKPLFMNSFKNVLINMFYQSWNSTIKASSRYILYKEFKSLLEPEKYLSIITEIKYRNVLIRLRAGLLRLKVNEGRWADIDLRLRLCPICETSIENEYHFTLECEYYNDIRHLYLPTTFCNNPNMHKFKTLLSSSCKQLLGKLCKYLYYSYERRRNYEKPVNL